MAKKITKKEIVETLRTYDVTKICTLYKRIHGSVPTEERLPYMGNPYRCLCSFQIYKWTKQYSTCAKMDRRLYDLLSTASHHWAYSFYDEHYAHTFHSVFAPLPRHAARLYFQHEKERGYDNGFDNYSKVAMMGETYLYACSPVYGHNDYNKARILPKKGNEKFCEILIKKYGHI